MKGKILIESSMPGMVEIAKEIDDVSWIDKMVIFDALCNIFELSEEDRQEIGVMIRLGGLGAITGKHPVVVTIDADMIDEIREKGNKNNETDAH